MRTESLLEECGMREPGRHDFTVGVLEPKPAGLRISYAIGFPFSMT